MFVSVNGIAREVKEIFAGGSDGLAHKVNEVFGSVDGIAKLIYTNVKHAPNSFDNFTWAQIKILADNGELLDHFNRGDLVDVKFKTPLYYADSYGEILWYQDSMTFQLTELSATGMKLVAYCAVPYRFMFTLRDTQFLIDAEASSSYWDRDLEYALWGLSEGLYKGCKAVDQALPDDMRAVLKDWRPCHKYEYYYDEGRRGYYKCQAYRKCSR